MKDQVSTGSRVLDQYRDLHGLDASASQERIEGRSELPGSVADQEPEIRGAIAEIDQEVADLLCGPRPVRIRGHAEDVHAPRSDLDHEEAVQALQRHRAVDVEEAGREHRGGLRVQERPPGRVGVPPGCRRDLQGLEDPADGRCADPVADLQQLTLDPLVSPPLVLAGQPLDQRGDLSADRRPSRLVRVGPLAGDQAAVPAQDGAGGDEELLANLGLQTGGTQPSRRRIMDAGRDPLSARGERALHRPWAAEQQVPGGHLRSVTVLGRRAQGQRAVPGGERVDDLLMLVDGDLRVRGGDVHEAVGLR